MAIIHVSDTGNGSSEAKLAAEIRDLFRKIADLERKLGCCSENSSFYENLAEHVTTIAGLKEAVSAKQKPLKIFWSILVLVGIGATFFYVYETGQQYLEYATATNIVFERNASYEHPPILLCPNDWIDPKKLKSLGLSVEAVKYSIGFFDHYHNVKMQNVTAASLEFRDFFYSHNYSSLPHFYESIGMDLLEAKSVPDLARLLKPSYYCNGCQGDVRMRKMFLDDVGVCYRFYLSNEYGGLARSNWNDIFIKTMNGSSAVYADKWSAWYLYYSNGQDMDSVATAFLFIKPSIYTFIKVSTKKYVSLKKSNQMNCMPSETPEGRAYNSLTCVAKCENRFYLEKFKCKMWLIRNRTSDLNAFCNFHKPYKNGSWGEYMYSDEQTQFYETVSASCSEQCPHKCERYFYDISIISQHDLVDADYAHVSYYLIRQNVPIVALNVVHSAVQEGRILVYVEVHTYSFIEFVNNVGGTLGLFVGGTIMTLVQFGMFAGNELVRRISMGFAA